jgi:branched-chain amino acid transport system ATP-binding protein
MLKIDNLVVAYGGIEALKGISLDIEKGKIVTLIGANGAGKSTTLRSIMGLVKPKGGSITYMGKNLFQMKTKDMVKEGIIKERLPHP